MSATVLVTGYGGFLGAEICRQLIEQGFRVRGVARQSYGALAALGVECVQGSVVDPMLCERVCEGVDAIIHTAALAGVWGPRREYETTNVTATESLLEGARRHRVRAFVQTSSPSVTFDGSPQSGIDENVPYPAQWLCDYPRTKAISEQAVLAANAPDRLLTCALRPHLIWGVGDPHLIPRVLDRCRSGRLRRVGPGTNLIDTVHVESAACAHVLALHQLLAGNTAASGKAYFITDGEPVPCWEWISTILRCGGLEPPKKSISLANAYRAGALLEGIYRVLRIRSEPPMTRFVALQLGVDHYFRIDAARKYLGYEPQGDRKARIDALRAWLSP
ncbi:MAG: NAD-dependent epimerase/dehydratase family protein [Planctomycetota bacterium]